MYMWLFIVPILAKAFAKLERVANVNMFSSTFELSLELPFSWKVFYFSALSFAAANLIFILRCYSLVKDHKSFADFRDQGKGERQLEQYAREAGLAFEEFAKFAEVVAEDARLEGRHLQEPFWRIYEGLNEARPAWRAACGVLYLVGFILISIVLLQSVLTVVRLTF